MASYSVLLSIFCSLCLMFSDSVINFQRFHHYPALQQTVCNSNDVLFRVSTATDIACSVVCVQMSFCRSYMYNSDTKDCIGCSLKYTETSGVDTVAGYGYYENTTDNYNASCESTLDCNGKNMVCEKTRLQCVCFPGYSYKLSSRSCVAGCEVYGNTYETYPKHKLKDLNRHIYANSNFDHCANKCNNVTAYQCRAFEIEAGSCRLSTATALTNPKALRPDHDSAYYNRNCA